MSPRCPLRLAFLLVFAPALSLHAQTVERVRVPARTEWAERGRTVVRTNAALLRAARPSSPLALSGTLRQAMIPVAFIDEPFQYAASDLSHRYFGSGSNERYSLTRYFHEMSGGTFTVTGEVTSVVQLGRTSASYVGGRNPNRYGGVADDLPGFVSDALEAADRLVDWRAFVAPGERTVPVVILVTAGPGGHCPSDITHIWPHRWHATGVFGKPFETSSHTPSGETILIDDFIVQPAEECAGGLAEIGVLAHETGHLLGLPDLYNTRDGGATSPVGHWDLMATGNYNRPASPAALGAWSRAHLGWANVNTPSVGPEDSTSLSIPPVLTSRDLIRLPLDSSDEYVLVENRRRTGTDQHVHGEGLLFWYVDPQAVSQRIPTNSLNDDLARPAVSVIAADGRRDMEENINDGDAGDVWSDAAIVNGFGAGTDREIVGQRGSASWSLTDLSWHAGMTAGVVLRQGESAADFSIAPNDLGPFMTGTRLDVRLRTEPSIAATWHADTAQLTALGLTLDSGGRLHGMLIANPGDHKLTVEARAASGRSVSHTWDIQIMPYRTIDGAVVARALLGDTRLDPETEQLLDAAGNRNGRLDVGDIVLAVRAGLIDAESLRRRP